MKENPLKLNPLKPLRLNKEAYTLAVTTENFLTHTRCLLSNLPDKTINEIELRSAVRSAYYGAYHEALSTLTQPIIAYKGMGIHQAFITYLKEDAHRFEPLVDRSVFKRLAIILTQLKSLRQIADYHLQLDIAYKDAQLQLMQSQTLFGLCAAIKKSGLKS